MLECQECKKKTYTCIIRIDGKRYYKKDKNFIPLVCNHGENKDYKKFFPKIMNDLFF